MLTFWLLGAFTLFFFLGVPVALAMVLSSLVVLLFLGDVPLVLIPQIMVTGMTSFEFLAVPFFILAAELMNAGGITERIFNAALVMVGRIRGGLAQVNVVASVIFAGISGTAIADIAGLGRIEFKVMTKNGYDPGFSCAVTLASCLIGPLIPPSVAMILFGLIAEVSIGRMLLAGVIPGLLVAFCTMVYIYWLVSCGRVQAPPVTPMSLRESARHLWQGLPAILAPVVLVSGIVSGIVTTTEAGVAACIYCFLVALIFYRELTWARFRQVMVSATLSSGLIMLMIGAGTVMAWIVTVDQSAVAIAHWFAGLTDQVWIQLFLINIFLLLVGCLIEGVPALLILVPVLMPMAQELGIDPVHFGVIFVYNLLIGLLTPPVGLGLFVMANVSGVSFETVTRSTMPFLIPLLAVLALITYVPWFSLYLPNLLLP